MKSLKEFESVHGKLLPISIVAKRIKISRSTAYKLIEIGQLKAIKTGCSRGLRVPEKELEKKEFQEYRESAERRNGVDGIVYFISAGKEAIKIGYSQNDVSNRLKILQIGNHLELNLLGTVQGGVDKEWELHQLFLKYKIRGEWFKFNDEICKFIIGEIDHANKK